VNELIAILKREEQAAVSYYGGDLASAQEQAMAFYDGLPFGDEEDGRSQFVTRDVAEVVDHMVVSVLRTFVSGDHVVEFESGDAAAAQVTDAVHYAFMRKQDGYGLLSDWLKAGLLERFAVVKTAAEEVKKTDRRTATVQADVLPTLMQEVDIVAATENEDGTFQVALERTATTKRFVDYFVPAEEFLFPARIRSLDTSTYLCHRTRKSRSDLIAMGYAADVVANLPTENGYDIALDGRRAQRFHDEPERAGTRTDAALQEVMFREEYVLFDADGDGVAERLKVCRVGDTLLAVDRVDEQPFVGFCPFPMPGRLVGGSLADKVMDIQRLRSILVRQALDSMYLANAPRTLVNESALGANTLDDLLTVRPGGIIRWKGAQPPTTIESPFAAQAALAMLEFASGERESRTGITRMNQGLDADALNKTATGTAMMIAKGEQMEDYVARNFANAVAQLFAKKYRLMRDAQLEMTVLVEGKAQQVNTADWPDELDVNIRVGLGTGRKDQRLAMRQMVVGLQAQALQAGLPIVSPKTLYNAGVGIVADANIGPAADYFIDPDTVAPQAPETPPEQTKLQTDVAMRQAELELKRYEVDQKLQLERERMALELQLAREKIALAQANDTIDFRTGGDLSA
jgi:hypothetical protein